MTSSFVYPAMIEEIRAVCSDHVSGIASADDVQRVIQRGEATVVAISEKDVRNFLTDTEGELELVKFTVDDARQFAETKKRAQHVLSWLSERERQGATPHVPPSSA